MRRDLKEWYDELEKFPEDWSVRVRLVEAAVSIGDIEEARRLVRTSPGDGPLPQELQSRLHFVLTQDDQGGAGNELPVG
tara:strand:+ start:1900 stop:2136 length:237 start_codon:yes stop_codon:yes gene_type:complete